MNNYVGINHRFKNESLYVGQQLKPEGFGAGDAGKQAALKAAHAKEGSELIYHNEKGEWFAQEVGEAAQEGEALKSLSLVDAGKIELKESINTLHDRHGAFVSYADERPQHAPEQHPQDMSLWQKMKFGNGEAIGRLAHSAKVHALSPLATGADLAEGMVVNTWTTLTNPGASLDRVTSAYQHDKIDGLLEGAKVAGSLAASAALVVGAGSALTQGGVKLRSYQLGHQMTEAAKAGNMAQYNLLKAQAQNVAGLGRQVAQVTQVAGQVGKAAGTALVGVTALSLAKNQVDLARADSHATLQAEIHQITAELGSLGQSAAFYAAGQILNKLGEQAKKLYTENRNYKALSPEQQAQLNQLIETKSQSIAQRVSAEVPDFNPQTWQKLSETQQLAALEQVHQIFAQEMGMKAPHLKVENMGQHGGFYHFDSHTTVLNKNTLGSLSETVNALGHENFHGWQNALSESFFKGNMNIPTELRAHIMAWRDNQFITGYADPTKTPGLTLGNTPLVSPQAMGDIFPGLDSMGDYLSQPLEQGAHSMGQVLQGVITPD